MSNTGLRPGEQYYKVENYSMKCRIYPNKTQQKMIDQILHGVHAICNMVGHDIQTNMLYTKETVDDENGEKAHWINISEAKKKENIDKYREQNSCVALVPASAISNMKCSCFNDIAKQYKKLGEDGKYHNLPVERVKHKYYKKKEPRRSYTCNELLSKVKKSDNKNVFYFNFAKVGYIKVRGWNKRLRFGENGSLNFVDFSTSKEGKKKSIFVQIIKDNCGDYFAIFKFSHGVMKEKELGFYTYVPKKIMVDNKVGIDVGVKTLATLSDGTMYENKKFKENALSRQRVYNRQSSRAWGWANIKFRKAHEKDKSIKPSKSYERIKIRNAKLSREIARRREYYQNFITTDIVNRTSFIGIESLDVKGMMDHERLKDKCGTNKKASKYAERIADAAMSSLLTKLNYKSEWYGRRIVAIGRYIPSSKTCSNCGHIMEYMGEEIRKWTCPECGKVHDRDINAAINILKYALDAA